MSEAAFTALRFGKHLCFLQVGLLISGHDHLRYPVTVSDDESFISPVYQRDSDLSAIVAVYSAYAVGQPYAVLHGKSAARTYLHFEARRYHHEQPRR